MCEVLTDLLGIDIESGDPLVMSLTWYGPNSTCISPGTLLCGSAFL